MSQGWSRFYKSLGYALNISLALILITLPWLWVVSRHRSRAIPIGSSGRYGLTFEMGRAEFRRCRRFDVLFDSQHRPYSIQIDTPSPTGTLQRLKVPTYDLQHLLHIPLPMTPWRLLDHSEFLNGGYVTRVDGHTISYLELGTRMDAWGVPLWVIAVPVLLVLAWRLRKVRWQRRDGVCAHCGYDLRGTPHRCPECGTVPLQLASTSFLTGLSPL